MLEVPRSDLTANSFDFETAPFVSPSGFREYDARWLFGKEINLLGIQSLGLGLGTYLHDIGVTPIRISQIVHGQRAITVDTAMRLARCFGGDARSWLNLQAAYDLRVAERANAKRIEREVTPVLT